MNGLWPQRRVDPVRRPDHSGIRSGLFGFLISSLMSKILKIQNGGFKMAPKFFLMLSDHDENQYLRALGYVDSESGVRFFEFKMADPRWQFRT